MVVFSTEMGHLDDKKRDFKQGALSLNWQIVSIHYYLECQDIIDNAGDNKL